MNFWVVINSHNSDDFKEVENCIDQLFSEVNVQQINCNRDNQGALYTLSYDLNPQKNSSNLKINNNPVIGLTGWVKNCSTGQIYSSLLNPNLSEINITGDIIGEFSLCILNSDYIFIATDYYSTNRVYFYTDSNRIVYSSDIRILLLLNFIKYELNHEAIKFSLSKDYCINEFTLTDNETYFLGIKKLPENTLLKINRKTNDVNVKFPFIKIEVDDSLKLVEQKEAAIIFRELLNSCVKDRVEAGISGLMLSGGIDSSTILGSLINNKLEKDIFNYTISFPDTSLVLSQDKFLVQKIIEEFKLNHEFISLSADLRFCQKNDYLYFVDGPLPDANPLGLIQIGRNALKNNDEILLTGEGGDVVLGEATEDYLIDLILKKEKIRYTYQYIKKMGFDSLVNRIIILLSAVHPKLSFYTVKYYEDSSRDININYFNSDIINTSKHVIGDYKTTRKVLKKLKFSSAYHYYIYSHLYPGPSYLTSSNSLFLCSYPLLDPRVLSFAFSINPLHNIDYHNSNLNTSYEHSKMLARIGFQDILPEYLINKKRKTLYALMSRKMFENSRKFVYEQALNSMFLEKYGYINREKYLDYVIGYIQQVKDENFDLGLYYQYVRCTYESELWLSRFDTSKKNVVELIKYKPL